VGSDRLLVAVNNIAVVEDVLLEVLCMFTIFRVEDFK
jgi:hypothetical protein